MKTVLITAGHLKLLRKMNIRWNGCEFGAPAVDCKRPYGNRDVYGDIADILGLQKPDFDAGEDWEPSALDLMDQIHADMQDVLQAVVQLGCVEPGMYVSEDYGTTWEIFRSAP